MNDNTKKVLLLDLDDTILDFSISENRAVKQTLKNLGLPCDEQVAADYKIINVQAWKEFEQGIFGRETLISIRFDRLLSKLGISGIDGATVNREYCKNLALQGDLLQGSLEFLQKAQERFRVIGVSNGTSKIQWSRIEISGIAKYFERIYVSEDIGFRKPTVEFFDYVCKDSGFDPKNAVIFGDSLTSDVQGGKNYGIKTIWFNLTGAESSSFPDYTVESFEQAWRILCEICSKENRD